jgi:hypothetical protein
MTKKGLIIFKLFKSHISKKTIIKLFYMFLVLLTKYLAVDFEEQLFGKLWLDPIFSPFSIISVIQYLSTLSVFSKAALVYF